MKLQNELFVLGNAFLTKQISKDEFFVAMDKLEDIMNGQFVLFPDQENKKKGGSNGRKGTSREA